MSNLKYDIKTTLGFWEESRIDGRSASMCTDAEFVNIDILNAFDSVAKLKSEPLIAVLQGPVYMMYSGVDVGGALLQG